MNFTNADIRSTYRSVQSNRQRESLRQVEQDQDRIALSIDSEIDLEASEVRKYLGSLNNDKLQACLNDESKRIAIRRLIEAIVVFTPRQFRGQTSWLKHYTSNFIRSYFSRIDHTMKMSINKVPEVVQLFRETGLPEIKANLIAEFGLNPLHSYCPNFHYYYFRLPSLDPVLNKERVPEVFLIDEEDKTETNVSMWEVVKGDSLETIILELSAEQLRNYLTQIFLALAEAELQCEFTHYKLSPRDIYIQSLKTPFTIEYRKISKRYDRPYRLTVEELVKITDFRKAHAKFQIIRSGSSARNFQLGTFSSNSFPDRPWVLQDYYRLICLCLLICYNNRGPRSLVNLLEAYLRFFTREKSLREFVEEQAGVDYYLPYSGNRGWTTARFLDYCRSSDLLSDYLTNAPIYRENDNVFQALGLREDLIENSLCFFDRYSQLQLEGADTREIKDRFQFYQIIDQEIGTLTKTAREITQDQASLNPPHTILALLVLIDKFIRFKFSCLVNSNVCKIFSDTVYLGKIRDLLEPVQGTISRILDVWDPIIEAREQRLREQAKKDRKLVPRGQSHIMKIWQRMLSWF